MTTATYHKAMEITDDLLGREGMHKYPFFLLIGLLFISLSLRKYRSQKPVFD
jgi:hypothetical protein